MTNHTDNGKRTYPSGVPCWVDTQQPDLDQATTFYGELFGWSFADAMPAGSAGSYLIASLDGKDVAAIGGTGTGTGTSWRTYIACADAEATCADILRAGGSVVAGPQDVGPAGRTASVADPQGAAFSLWQPARQLGAQLVNVPGTWNFSDLHTPDPDGVLPFYATVFGWEVEADQGAGMVRLPGYGDHLAATIDPDVYERQASVNAPSGFADVVAGLVVSDDSPGWQVRFTVADRDATLGIAERLGGTVVRSTQTRWTKEALIRDPQGAELTVSQFAPQG
jgi:uncharacterized protein